MLHQSCTDQGLVRKQRVDKTAAIKKFIAVHSRLNCIPKYDKLKVVN